MTPIYINNRNWLTPVQRMVAKLRQIREAHVVIIDNNSTYQPLLDWYVSCGVHVVKLGRNGGPQAPWTLEHLCMGEEFYVVTDPDLDIDNVPLDMLDYLKSGLREFPERIKAGLSLEASDLPDTELGRQVKAWEEKFWQHPMCGFRFFDADVDTTFAMYRADFNALAARNPRRPALRAVRPYTARHLPWYIHPKTMTEEEMFYFACCGRRWSSWANRITGQP